MTEVTGTVCQSEFTGLAGSLFARDTKTLIQWTVFDWLPSAIEVIHGPIRYLHHCLVYNVLVGLDTEFDLPESLGHLVVDLVLDGRDSARALHISLGHGRHISSLVP
jgi:hypothetical protein